MFCFHPEFLRFLTYSSWKVALVALALIHRTQLVPTAKIVQGRGEGKKEDKNDDEEAKN